MRLYHSIRGCTIAALWLVVLALIGLPTSVCAGDAASATPARTRTELGESRQRANDELREAIWQLERIARKRLGGRSTEAVARREGTSPSLPSLRDRWSLLSREAGRIEGNLGQTLVRKLRAVRLLLHELERVELATWEPGPRPVDWNLGPVAASSILATGGHGHCADAAQVGEGHYVAGSDTRAAGGTELWLSYTASKTGLAVVSTAGSTFDTTVEVYSACPAEGEVAQAQGDDELGLQSRAGFPVSAGDSRWIRVGGWQGARGTASVHLEAGASGIGGVVRREETGDSRPFEYVALWDSDGWFAGGAPVADGGGYQVLGLSPDTYWATTSVLRTDLLAGLFDGPPCIPGSSTGCIPNSARPVHVGMNEVVGGIDFSLGAGARITGHVRTSNPAIPLGARVELFDEAGYSVDCASLSVAGRYTFQGLDGGVYYVGATSDYYQWELFRDVPWLGGTEVTDGTPIEVAEGETIIGIDFDLEAYGVVEGRLTEAVGGAPISLHEAILSGDDSSGDSYHGYPDLDGNYRIVGVKPGVYYATTSTFGEYQDEAYDDVPCSPCIPPIGDPIAVSLESAITGIDFGLNRLGTLTGQITDSATGLLLGPAEVRLYDSAGTYLESALTFYEAYELPSLVAGSYRLTASAEGYRTQLFDGFSCSGGAPLGCDPASGTPVTVSLDADAQVVDFSLVRLGSIEGRVLDSATGQGLSNAAIEVWSEMGQVAGTMSELSPPGFYRVVGLEPGDYFIVAWRPGYIREILEGIWCETWAPSDCDPLSGTPVPVLLGATTSSVDIVLDRLGSLSGVVRDASNNLPVQNSTVSVYNASLQRLQDAATDASGGFEAGGLDSGTYYVLAWSENHSYQLYDHHSCSSDGCPINSGDPLTLAIGEHRTGIDFDLEPRGTITGVVNARYIGPVSALVRVYGMSGDYFDSTNAVAGSFSLVVPAGSWFVTAARSGTIQQLYDGIDCPSPCDVTAGTAVVVAAGTTTGEINFELLPTQGIAGRVVEDGGRPLPGVAIDLWDEGGALVSSRITNQEGEYLLLPPAGGTWFLSTDSGLGAVDEVWNDQPCPFGSAYVGLCDPTAGDPVIVPSPSALVTGIDFVLATSVFFDGFESGDTARWSSSSN